MKQKIVNFFDKSNSIISWFHSEGLFKMTKSGNIIIGAFLGVALYSYLFGDSFRVINNFLVVLLIIIVYFIFFITSFRFYWIKPPKFIRKESKNPVELFNRYSHWSYLYGIFIYSFFSSFFIFVILYFIIEDFFNIYIDYNVLFSNLFFIIAGIFSLLYFLYHFVIKGIKDEFIKARLALYVAITTTISAGLYGLSLREVLQSLIVYLGISFSWLLYFIEKIKNEEN